VYETESLDRATDSSDGRLLLVEDDDGDAFLVEELLLLAGNGFEITRARTLAEARQLVKSQPFGCVLLDLGLPDGQGLEVVREFLSEASNVAVICFTGLNDDRSGAAAVAAGAQDYLVKGQVDGDLLRRSIRYAMERRRAEEQSRQLYASQLRAEENARLERGLLPLTQTNDPALGVTARYRPRLGELLGGNFYDVVEMPDGRVYVLLGDVAGHGPDEAALGVSLRIAWRALVLAGADPGRILPVLEELLIRERRSDEIFVQASFCVIEPDRLAATLWLAAHLPPMLLDPAPTQLPGDPTSSALGLLPPGTWRGRRISLPPNWRLLFYTDGLVEGRRGKGLPQILGVPGLLEFAKKSRTLSSGAAVVDDLLDRVQRAHGGAMPDDVAVVSVHWPNGTSQRPEGKSERSSKAVSSVRRQRR
jgi:serine phosphatase RsbU (regulator of sigma subunit)